MDPDDEATRGNGLVRRPNCQFRLSRSLLLSRLSVPMDNNKRRKQARPARESHGHKNLFAAQSNAEKNKGLSPFAPLAPRGREPSDVAKRKVRFFFFVPLFVSFFFVSNFHRRLTRTWGCSHRSRRPSKSAANRHSRCAGAATPILSRITRIAADASTTLQTICSGLLSTSSEAPRPPMAVYATATTREVIMATREMASRLVVVRKARR